MMKMAEQFVASLICMPLGAREGARPVADLKMFFPGCHKADESQCNPEERAAAQARRGGNPFAGGYHFNDSSARPRGVPYQMSGADGENRLSSRAIIFAYFSWISRASKSSNALSIRSFSSPVK